MSDPDMPTKLAPAVRWVLGGIFLFVFFLISAEDINDGRYVAGSVWGGLFLATFILLLVWSRISWLARNWRILLLLAGVIAWGFLAYEILALQGNFAKYAAPRTLTPADNDKIVHALENQGRHAVTVKVNPKDGEAREYASKFVLVLQRAGWDVVWLPQKEGDPDPDANDGVCLNSRGDGPPFPPGRRPTQTVLQEALSEAGVFVCTGGDSSKDNKLYLLVGHRPLVVSQGEPLLWKLGNWLQEQNPP